MAESALPETRAAVSGSSPKQGQKPGSQGRKMVIQGRVDQHERIGATVGAIELPGPMGDLAGDRQHQGRLEGLDVFRARAR